MYRRIYYDGSKIYLWETTPEGKRVSQTIKQEIEYYIPDKKGISHTKDIYGNPVIKQVSKNRFAVNELKSSGVQCCETDIPETIKFLQKRYAGVDLKPDMSIFKVAVIDIENEGSVDAVDAPSPINLITLRNLKNNRTYTFGTQKYTGDSKTVDNYMDCSSEEELLINFLSFFRHCNFDVVTGWNVLGFDIRYIHNRLKVYGIEKTMSPIDEYYVDDKNNITVGGINILDYQQMYKEFLKKPLSSYSLNYVSLLELDEGKLELEGSVNQIYKTNWNRFVEYNINDVELVHKLDKKLKLINLCVTLAYQALIPFEKTLATIPVVEGYFLKALHARNMVMNDRTTDSSDREEYTGGYVRATPGFYEHVLSFDVESMYPHLIMQFNISPETIVMAPANTEGLIRSTVPGVYYRKDIEGFIPQMVKGIFKDRKRFKSMMSILKLHEKGLDAYTISKRLKLKLESVERKLEIIAKEKESVSYYDLQQYVRKILINCFHKDTEILTVDGVKNICDVKIGDFVYSINPNTSELEIKQVKYASSQLYCGYMNRIKNTTFDECVTPEHRMLIQNKKDEKIEFVTSDVFADRCVNHIPIHAAIKYKTDEYIYISDFIDLDKYEGLLWYGEKDLRYVKQNLSLMPNLYVKQCNNRKQMAFITSGLTKENIKILYADYGYFVYLRPKNNRKCGLQKARINTDSLSKFIGFYLSEGSLYAAKKKKYKNTVRGISKIIQISQYTDVNPSIYEEIKIVMADVFTSEHINSQSLHLHKKGISISSYVMYDFIISNFGSLHDKRIYSEVTPFLNKKLIFACMYKGDGDKGNDTQKRFRYTITYKNKKLFNDTMRLLLEIGCMPRYKVEKGKFPVYRINRNKTSFYTRKIDCLKEMYNDTIYCLSVADNHTVCAGMNGKFAWTGQSVYGAMANPYFHYFNINNAKSVTVGGQTLIQHLSKGIDDFLMPKYGLKKSPTVIIDTDSCYIHMQPMLTAQKITFGNQKEEIDYFVKYIDDEFSPVIATALDSYAATYGTKQLINFKHEKIIQKQAVIVKKHYISQVSYSEGDHYDPPKMKYVGVQIVRSDTPEFCRKKLKENIDLIFNSMDREKVVAEIYKIREEFMNAPIGAIASTKGLGKYNDYARPVAEYIENGVYFPPHCPIQIQAAIAYNFFIEKFKLPLLPAHKGAKIKYVYVNGQNIAQTHVIGFLGKWPEEFNQYFKVDQELQFEKTFMPVIEDLFSILKWEDVSYEQSILEDILS